MSEHEVRVLKVEEINPHPNADKLEIAKIFGYDVVVAKNSYKTGDLAAFIEPDYMVPLDSDDFSFLKDRYSGKTHGRIKKIRLRGQESEGLLIKARGSWSEGDNVAQELGVFKYEPPATRGGDSGYSDNEPVGVIVPKYDLEPYKKYSKYLNDGEEVFITGKIHGANARFVYVDGKMYAGSRTTWKKEPGVYFDYKKVLEKRKPIGNMWAFLKSIFTKEKYTSEYTRKIEYTYTAPDSWWWRAVAVNSWIKEWCMRNPGVVLYGEVYGPTVQGADFHYGVKPGEIGFAVFDVYEDGAFISSKELFENERYATLNKVELLYNGPFSRDILHDCANSECPLNGLREGAVVKPVNETFSSRGKRIAFKYISDKYDDMH